MPTAPPKNAIEYLASNCRAQRSFTLDEINVCIYTVELALHRGNADEAKSAIDRLFATQPAPQGELAPLSVLTLPLRVQNMLEADGIFNVAQLRAGLGNGRVARIVNIGEATIAQCWRALGLYDTEATDENEG